MTKRAFGNALRILRNIDLEELEAAGIIPAGDSRQMGMFLNHPDEWFIRADDQQTDAIWGMIQARQPQELVA